MMHRRKLFAIIVAAIASVVPARAEEKACKLFGRHRWVFDRNEPCETEPLCKGWWWEFYKCKCGAQARELVASPRG